MQQTALEPLEPVVSYCTAASALPVDAEFDFVMSNQHFVVGK